MRNIIKKGLELIQVGSTLRKIKKSTDEETRSRARRYLMELLGKSRGLPTKVGQFMALDEDDENLRLTLSESTPAMSHGEFLEELTRAYGAPWNTLFKSVEKDGRAASLGQVHRAVLRDGRQVAVKVRYPGIADSVETEMKIFGWLPRVGPVSKWGFDLEGYREALHENFLRELDYLLEAERQSQYFSLCRDLDDVVIPGIVPELICPTVLVQEWQTGISFQEAVKLPESDRLKLGRAILRHYFHMLFRHGCIHSDPNPENFAFRIEGESGKVVVYDFGSILKIDDSVRLGLIRTILAVSNHEPVDPASCLASLGFDTEKLKDLRPTLPALIQVLFDPFVIEAPYHARDWRISERFDGIVGDMKWWFRSAAPPGLIFLMRILHGMTTMLKRLDVPLPWRFIMNQVCRDIYPMAQAYVLPEVPRIEGAATGFHEISRRLQVYVRKADGNEVKLTMPSRVVDDLEGIIDPPVMEAIREQKIDLAAIQKRVRKSGFVPQELFEVKDDQRYVRVWLE